MESVDDGSKGSLEGKVIGSSNSKCLVEEKEEIEVGEILAEIRNDETVESPFSKMVNLAKFRNSDMEAGSQNPKSNKKAIFDDEKKTCRGGKGKV